MKLEDLKNHSDSYKLAWFLSMTASSYEDSWHPKTQSHNLSLFEAASLYTDDEIMAQFATLALATPLWNDTLIWAENVLNEETSMLG